MSGRVAVVTGASRGIGAAIAAALAEDGHLVACVATGQAGAEQAAAAVGGKGFACDVSDPGQVKECHAQIVEALGAPAVLVNNAGVTRDALLVRTSDEDWDRVLDVNLKGSFLWARACAPGMMKARWGRIVNVGSVVGLVGAAGQANYAASKAGLFGLTKALAKELGSRGITCNLVAPGFIETDMTQSLPEEVRAKALASTPLGRLGTAGDVAGLVRFLASDQASFITGQAVAVDGGMVN